MQRKSKHKEITDPNKSSKCPVVKSGYLDTANQSNNNETQEENKSKKYPVVESGYLDTTKQSNNNGAQEEKKNNFSIYKIILCFFIVCIIAIVVYGQSSPEAFELFTILLIFLAMLFLWIIKK